MVFIAKVGLSKKEETNVVMSNMSKKEKTNVVISNMSKKEETNVVMSKQEEMNTYHKHKGSLC